MNFFERQMEVRKSSARLVWLFALAVFCIVIVANVVVGLAATYDSTMTTETMVGLVIFTSAITVGAVGLTSLVKTASLRRGGGGQVARQLGGVYVEENTRDPQLRRLRNVVEEVSIASGTPVPEVYVLPREHGINAFAAGHTPSDAAIAVTRGTLERLNRDELQGVIAHEFSHIVNGDMRLNIRLIGVLAGLTALAVVGRMLLWSGGGRNRHPALVLFGGVTFLAGYIGVFFGRMIKAGIARQREYLADASAVQFTRQTEGIAGALKKIGGLTEGSKINNAHVEDVSHMLFGEGRNFASLYATHPPLVKRIQQLEPQFNPDELTTLQRQWASSPPSGMAEDSARGFSSGGPSGAPPQGRPIQGRAPSSAGTASHDAPAAPARPAALAVRADALVAGVGEPGAASYEHGGNILRSIPDEFRERARGAETVVPLIFGLLMSANPDVRARQHAELTRTHGTSVADAAWQEGAALATLDAQLRLPLSEVAFSALRHRSAEEIERVKTSISALVRADGRLSVFEYCLSTLLHTELHEAIHHRPPWGHRRHSLARNGQAVADLLAVLSLVGHNDRREAEQAYRAGLQRVLPGAAIPFAPPPQGLVALGRVWPVVDGLDGREKALLIGAMVTVISHDGEMTIEEIELVRTVCALLHCPVPPLTPGPVAGENAPQRQR